MRSRVVIVAVGMSLLASAVSAVAEPPDPPGRDGLPALQAETSVSGGGVTVPPLPGDLGAQNVAVQRATWPAAGAAEVRLPEVAAAASTSATVRAGELPVWVGRGSDKEAAGRSVAHEAGRVKVELLDRRKAEAAGVRGVLLRVSPVDGDTGGLLSVRLNYKEFASAFGGDYGQRLRLVTLPECVLSTPDHQECGMATPVPSVNSAKRGEMSGEFAVKSDTPVVLAAAAGPSSGLGDFKATSLSPAGSWSAGGSSGDFTYSYPLRLPPALGGAAPALSLGYSSGGVDGRTSATNNQASWIGDGWDLSAGFIERRYKGCHDDGQTGSGDLCWATDNAFLSLNGKSTELIKDANSGVWHLKDDDGSRVEKLADAPNGAQGGEHWKVTTVDGTQYVFGLYRLPGWATGKTETRSVWWAPVFGNNAGEPCHQATFEASSCRQAYRWNLDYVVDPHGNATGYFYEREGNFYARNGNTATPEQYIRGGWLAQVNYGLRANDLYATAPASVRFDMTERCVPSGAITCAASQLNAQNASAWPDVPFDQICNQNETCTNRKSPTFFSRKRLARIVTSINGGAKEVDSWALTQSYPPVDEFAPSMWLNSIKHSGLVGGNAGLPATTFGRIAKPNRVDSDADHGRPPLIRNRIARVVTEAGGLIGVGYTEPDCRKPDRMPAAEHTNTLRCFPQWWLPPGAFEPVEEYFHKYVVTEVTSDPRTTGGSGQPVLTKYEYLDGGAWHFDENDLAPLDKRTWSQWRGYGRVRATTGVATDDQSVTETRYLRGMDGDRLPSGVRDVWIGETNSETGRVEDREPLQGQTLETLTYNGAAVAQATVYDPWVSDPTAVNGEKKAFLSEVAGERGRTLLTGTTWRRTQKTTTFNAQGIPTVVEDLGDTAVTGDETCTRNDYARNDEAWMLTYPKSVIVQYVPCGGHVVPGNGMREVRSSYDSQAWGTAPTKGDVTRVDELDTWDASGQTWVNTARSTFDAYGRVLETQDAENNKTTSAYTPASGAQVTSVKTTNALNQLATTTLEPAWALPLTTVGVSGATTFMEYDPLGRIVRGWKPGRSPLDNEKPDVVFDYQVNQNAASVTATKTLQDNDGYQTSYVLFDGLGREAQTQTPGTAGGRVLTDTFYDTRGLVHKTFQPYWNDQAPAATLFAAAADNMVPRRTVTTFDKLERPEIEYLYSYNNAQHWTTYAYTGDRVHMKPPAGGTATTTISDVHGRVTELRQYHAVTVGGTYDSTRYTYRPQGDLETITDPAGNIWRYGYDLRGRKTTADDPDRGHTSYTYDKLNQLATTTDARDQTLAYTYDKLGRKTGMFADSTTGTKLAEWTYDTVKPGLPTANTRFHNGQPYTTRIAEYDDADRPRFTEVVIPATEQELGKTYRFENAYTHNGKLDSVVLPAAGGLPRERVSTLYNAAGLPDQLVGTRGDDNPSIYVSTTNYSPYGEPLRLSLAATDSTANLSIGYQYHEATRRLAQLTSYRETSTGYKPVFDLNYTYDQIGNLTQVTDKPGGTNTDTQCFTYDYLRRLTQAWTPGNHNCTTTPTVSAMGGAAPYWLNWTFDNTGNRRTETNHTTGGDVTRTHTYPPVGAPRPHAVQTITTTGAAGNRVDNYGYDDTGNTTSRGAGSTLDYDVEGRLTEATAAAGTSNYVYDADGARLLKREPDATTLYLPGMELRRDATTGAVSATRYYTHNGTTIAVRTPTKLSWTLADHQATVTATVSDDATTVTRRYHDPYGNSLGPAPTNWPDRRGYLNAPTDATGLTHLGAREYDPTTGRFLSVDPIMDPADPTHFNGYAYSLSNPMTFSDSDGLYPICGCAVEGPIWHNPGKAQQVDDHRQQNRASHDGHWYDGPGVSSKWVPDQPRQPVDKRFGHVRIRAYDWTSYTSAYLEAMKRYKKEGYADLNPACVADDPYECFGSEWLDLYGFIDIICSDSRVICPEDMDSGVDAALAAAASSGMLFGGKRGAAKAAPGVDIAGARFAQTSYSERFSKGGLFSGRTINEVADDLRSGAMSPKDVPINVVVRDGNTLITNTRSAQALIRADIPRESWNVINRTGDPVYENLLSGQLRRNGLTSSGYNFPS